jgi:hypothetical protein
MFFNCIQGLDEVQKECWKIIENPDSNSNSEHDLELDRP